MNRTIVLRGPEQKAAAAATLAAISFDEPLIEVVFREHKAKRSLEANALMWARLDDISKQFFVLGRQYDAETWHEWFKRELLPEKSWSGKDKWKVLPNGERVLSLGTSDLTVEEMTTYLNELEVRAAEMGVQLRA